MSGCLIEQFFVILLVNEVAGNINLKTVDLTHAQSAETIYWPGNPTYNFTILSRGRTDGGYWYESNAFSTAEHGGTHLDAPAHFYEANYRAHQIPMSKLVGPGVIINVKSKAASSPDYRVSVSDLNAWERNHGTIPAGAIVIMNSGWGEKYPNKTLTFGSSTTSDPSTFHFPGWHEEAADWLVKNRNIHVLGVDTPSTDYGQSTTYSVHVILGMSNIPGLENVANLDTIPEAGSIIYVAVIKLYDGSGAPARVFATIQLDDAVNFCSFVAFPSLLRILMFVVFLRAMF